VAALTVVLFHFFSAYVPSLLPEQTDHPWWGTDTPLAVLYNGGFAVSVFFVLSGFVITNSAAARHLPVWFNLCARYVRLALPVLAGTLFGWALLALSPHTVAALKAVENHEWLNWVYDGGEPNIYWATKDALIRVFIHGSSKFNNVLWTMKIELLGSLAIYLLYGLIGIRQRVPTLVIAALASVIVLRKPELAAFAIGALIREAYVLNRFSARWAWPALTFGIVVGAMMEGYSGRLGFTVSLPRMLALGEPHQLWHVAAASALVYAVLVSSKMKQMLSTQSARFLGDISFGLYLVHVPLLYTLFVPIYLTARGDTLAMAILFAAFVATSLVAGWLFTRLVDRPTILVMRRARSAIQTPSGARSRARLRTS
jgi:peptidoglycan/LPS O-acetylase OafA/YrhL